MGDSGGPRIVLLGKQGAGKGTQSARLAEHYEVDALSTGELFRKAVALGTPIGLAVAEYLDQGELVPDEITLQVVDRQFAKGDWIEHGFILDGFPRTVGQAERLEEVLDGHPLDVAINLTVPTEVVLDRLAGRRVCEQCQATYHLNMPPRQNWTCDVCGGRVGQRPDDTEEAVLRRLELYDRETVPIVDFYRGRGRLVVVDAVGPGDEVFARLVAAVDAATGARLQ
jgi:adenylate kinase